jgi:predicted nucleic acid-binding protein
VRIVVETGVFSAWLGQHRRPRFEAQVGLMGGHQVLVAAVALSELRYGALVAGWGETRRGHLDRSIRATTVVPVSDHLLWAVAELRFACRRLGHPLHARAHANDLWIAASAIHIGASLLTTDKVFAGTPGLTLLE